MWVYLNDAFLSIVAHRDRPGDLLVRGRARGDLERVFPGCEVSETPAADYRFRTVLPRHQVAVAIARRLEGISYPNFKSSVREPDRHDVYMGVWGTTLRGFAQEPEPRAQLELGGWGRPARRRQPRIERRRRRRTKRRRVRR